VRLDGFTIPSSLAVVLFCNTVSDTKDREHRTYDNTNKRRYWHCSRVDNTKLYDSIKLK
jgi:hypothetical protein